MLMFSCEKTIELDETAHWAVEMLAELSRALQLETDVMEKAEVKVRETSKFVLNEVMAFRVMEYCEFADAAVLGLAEAEATVKLTCEWTSASRKRVITICVIFWVGGMLLIMICIY